MEKAKLINDYIKHINTLSTGSILLIITFFEKLFLKEETIWLIIAALISLFVSILGGVLLKTILTFSASGNIDIQELDSNVQRFFASTGVLLFLIGFLIGILAITVFGILNLTAKV
ncbi:hypothetical protein ABN763_10085 [Spongiivirga sp. MCCC 1A20706]|uniref:hypothetical protein n=1 Tax=Spongiivirga sp. MCCC 1A20706 TaxID=3160963 RepID=UPI00397778CC